MKKKLPFLILLSLSFNLLFAQWTNKTMDFGGLSRSYRVYKSNNYNASNPASLLISLHGLGDNMTNFSGIGFSYIADTANIICIFPQAVSDPLAGTAWNSGAGSFGYYPNSGVDDIGFINALVDTASALYSINPAKVYLCGFSMGGFMTQKMALMSNAKFAAFASMSGTIGSGVTSFNPGRPVPIAHFHGTSDANVAYSGNTFGFDADSLVNFWVNKNGCNTTPAVYSYPDLANDTITIDRFEYSNGDPQSEVWFFKMYGADHTVLFKPNNDMTEPIELWLFLQKHSLPAAGIKKSEIMSDVFKLFPNPSQDKVSVSGIPASFSQGAILSVSDLQGQTVLRQIVNNENYEMDISRLTSGFYVMKISCGDKVVVRKLVKE